MPVGGGIQCGARWAGLHSRRRILTAVGGATGKRALLESGRKAAASQERLLAHEVHAAGHRVALRAPEHGHAETQLPMPAQEASPVGVITAHGRRHMARTPDGTHRAPVARDGSSASRPAFPTSLSSWLTVKRTPPSATPSSARVAGFHRHVVTTLRAQPTPTPAGVLLRLVWISSARSRFSAGQQEAAESPTRGAPARAFGEQAKPQDPVLILATFLFALSTTYGSDGGGKKLLRRRRIGCHRIAPLLQSGDRLNAAQPEIRDA